MITYLFKSNSGIVGIMYLNSLFKEQKESEYKGSIL